jgi:hypothetical protein
VTAATTSATSATHATVAAAQTKATSAAATTAATDGLVSRERNRATEMNHAGVCDRAALRGAALTAGPTLAARTRPAAARPETTPPGCCADTANATGSSRVSTATATSRAAALAV